MTFDERVTALAALGFTPRQTRFLVVAALHAGYCLRRHYLTFAGVRYGKNVRDFFEALVRRHLARPLEYQPNRGHVFHLHATGLYRALAQRDNRNRRRVSPAAIARKLMLLDYVLTRPDADWYATEEDKVALFTHELGLSARDLPGRVYGPARQGRGTTMRYFVHKLPVYRAADGVIHFVCLVTDETGQELEQFLHDHVRLLTAVSAWAVVAVCPRGVRGFPACRSVFDRFSATTWRAGPLENRTEVEWFFATRQLVERGDLRSLSVADLNRFREARRRLASAPIEALYGAWLAGGERVLDREAGRAPATPSPVARLIVSELPSTYSQFGSFPGVC